MCEFARKTNETLSPPGVNPAGKIEETSISRTVSYADLDLVKASDADELRTRVRDTAKDLCTELDKLYPLEPKDPDCVRKSVDRAMVQADNAIEDARK